MADAAPALAPAPGKIVLYTLSASDADAINVRRNNAAEKSAWHSALKAGVVERYGNPVEEGQQLPAIVVRVWGKGETAAFNVQVMLDGQDTFWATSTGIGIGHGKCAWLRD